MSQQDQADQKSEEQKIAEEHQTWKQLVPDLYDLMVEKATTWPSLTCQWLPNVKTTDEYTFRELLIGTNTNDEEPNHVIVLQFDLPHKEYQDQGVKPRWNVVQRIGHEGEVHRARYQPSNPDIIATKTRESDVLVFDRKQSTEEGCTPILRLKGHTKEGYGLEWSPHAATCNHLLSAGYDHTICHWDIKSGDKAVEPYRRYEGHTGCVEDISWHATNDALFASVADDMKLLLWDTRSPSKPVQSIQAHRDEVNSVAFNWQQDWMIATGSSDKTVGLFDIRKIDTKLYSFELHEDQVHQVSWNPSDPAILASSSLDRRINVWDLRHIGEEQTPEDMEDGPPELLFIHSGHTSRISEFSWDPLEPWLVASAAEDNIIQVWAMTKNIHSGPADEPAANDLE
ncbi:hypothetical protein VTP01DRAFT_7199 [Rhizomucor pusillus]|uniref:uncharacterized protein n=1 Tax=Rhizomucor pusillus TaxID=4840 RepID=UPI003743CAA0